MLLLRVKKHPTKDFLATRSSLPFLIRVLPDEAVGETFLGLLTVYPKYTKLCVSIGCPKRKG